ncbi:hypothetical protein [Agromyces larvae]|uniref:DUF2178 domain-containing protein n=1 Tax=Agromyces larvae TaxID=2929802 RepID=A0ABY4C6S2_9MICO|nr:hypothetical protein [Agromyces larvae]UOE45791.1 hypothetical protein MTO99_08620 [Agromyces larvae]
MSYEEKGVWSFLAIAVVGYGVYLGLLLPRLAGTPIADVDFVWPMVWTIGGAIVAGIVVRILIEMLWPSEQQKPDARDREIDRTGDRVGNSFIVIGAIGAMVLCWFRLDWFWIANLVSLSFVISAVLSSLTKLVAYRRGGFQEW